MDDILKWLKQREDASVSVSYRDILGMYLFTVNIHYSIGDRPQSCSMSKYVSEQMIDSSAFSIVNDLDTVYDTIKENLK